MLKEIAVSVLCAVSASVLTVSLAAPGPQQDAPISAYDRVMSSHQLRCGYVNYPPYLEMDVASGQPKGVFADLLQEVGSRMGVEVVWAGESSWATLTEDLKTHRYDAVCSGIWLTAGRAAYAYFSLPVGVVPVGAWVRAGDARFTNSLDSLNSPDVRVAVMDGEAGEIIRKERFPRTQPVSLPQNAAFTDLLLNVATGKADVVFIENRIAHDFLRQNPGTLMPAAAENVLTGFPLTIMLPQDMDPRLKSAVDGALTEILYSGKMADILRANQAGDAFILPPMPWAAK